MNAFGKMGLLCCLAAVLLAGCGDGDRDVSAVSGPEVSIEQSREISGSASEDISLGEISWDEVSKDYSAEKQIGESGIFIAVKKLSSSQKVYALERGGKLITDFEFEHGFRYRFASILCLRKTTTLRRYATFRATRYAIRRIALPRMRKMAAPAL